VSKRKERVGKQGRKKGEKGLGGKGLRSRLAEETVPEGEEEKKVAPEPKPRDERS